MYTSMTEVWSGVLSSSLITAYPVRTVDAREGCKRGVSSCTEAASFGSSRVREEARDGDCDGEGGADAYDCKWSTYAVVISKEEPLVSFRAHDEPRGRTFDEGYTK